MVDPQAPKIEYPCDYPIKVIGRAAIDFRSVVVAIIQQHDPLFEAVTIKEIPSGKGTFVSLRLSFTATDDEHVKAIVADLMASGRVQMVI